MSHSERGAVARLLLSTILTLLATSPRSAHASCNLFPGKLESFAGARGVATRPFAAAGESVEIRMRSCDPEPSAFDAPSTDFLVTVVFVAPGGSQHAVVSTAANDCSAVNPHLAACAGQLVGVASTASCVDGPSGSGISIRDQDGEKLLGFRFPDTDALLGGPADDRSLAGEARIVVTRATDVAADGLPCGVASSGCLAATPTAVACIGDLFADGGDCGSAVADPAFSHWNALPPPNDYQARCFSEDPPCTAGAGAAEIRVAVDRDGNLLVPIAWDGILVRDQGIPVPRLVRARFRSPPPFTLSIPDSTFLGSFSPEGRALPPILESQRDPTAASNTLTLFGTADASYSVIRLLRRHGTCQGGARNGEPCSSTSDCPNGACPTTCVGKPSKTCATDPDCGDNGPCGSLFDFGPLASSGLLAVPRLGPGFCQESLTSCATDADCATVCVLYALEAEPPVPLDGLAASDDARAFVARESIDAKDRNADGDTSDSVVTLRDRTTGLLQPIGSACLGPAEGRAVVRVSEPPFSSPAVAVESDVLAFLESESGSGECDANGDGDNLDALLGIVRLGGADFTPSPLRAVEADPRINGRPIVVSEGLVFVRTSEAGMAARGVEAASVDDAGVHGDGLSLAAALTPDGRFVAFLSDSTNLVSGDAGFLRDVFLRDRQAQTTVRLSVAPDGTQGDGGSGGIATDGVSVSADGRVVAFTSFASNLVLPTVDANFTDDIFVRDVIAGVTERVSVAPDGTEADDASGSPHLTGDGRFVAFSSRASNLVANDTNGESDIFVRDLDSGVTERVSVSLGGIQGNFSSFRPVLSETAQFVAFSSTATNLLTGTPGDTSGVQIFVHDRSTGANELASVSSSGVAANNDAQLAGMSADGRFVAFGTGSSFTPDDTNGLPDIFVRDRKTGLTERVSVGTGGVQADSGASGARLSPDGRFVTFMSEATTLSDQDDDGFGTLELYLHDRVTGATEVLGPGSTVFPAPIAAIPIVAALGVFGGAAQQIVIIGPDRSDPFGVDALLFPDGELDDTVLEVVDTGSGVVTTLCPAGEAAVASGRAVFLRPETLGTTTPGCPDDGPLNGDGLVDDDVVAFWNGSGSAVNLVRAAESVALSATHVGALVSERGDGAIYNADGDQNDTVAQFHKINASPGTWQNSGQAADELQMAGSRGVFLTPEAAQGAILNGDGDTADRVLQVFDAAKPKLPAIAIAAAEEFVVGDPADTLCGDIQLVALRTSEAAQNDGSFLGNDDGDALDGVLQLYDLESGILVNTEQAVTPCRLVECDPRLPYRVQGSRVTFLTSEADQGGADLDGNGVAGGDLVLQIFDFCTGALTPLGAVTGGDPDPLEGRDESIVALTEAGRCDTGIVCAIDSDDCADGAFCEDDACDIETGTCIIHPALGCAADADCRRCLLRAPSLCLPNDDRCPAGSTCLPSIAVVAASTADADQDGVPDGLDTCPETADPNQSDSDGDGAGDVCDAEFVRPLSGKTLSLIDPTNADKRKVLVVSKDVGLPVPTADGGVAPTQAGGTLELFNPTTLESNTFALPAAHWTGLGKPAGSKGYRYRDSDGVSGPCSLVLYRPGKVLKAKCSGPEVAFTLDEPSQGSLAVAIDVGSKQLCMAFGGDVKRDAGRAGKAAGRFKATNAPSPGACPAAP